MPGEIRIITTRQEAGFDANSKPIESMRTEFMIGDDGPFVVRMPKEQWSGAAVNEAIEKMRRELDLIRKS